MPHCCQDEEDLQPPQHLLEARMNEKRTRAFYLPPSVCMSLVTSERREETLFVPFTECR